MRKLGSIQIIKNLQPIEGADRIELATINDWKVVVAKEVGLNIGDKVIYCEIDSFLPIEPEFEFLRKSSYKKMGDSEGFRLRTIRLRGIYSQGLIIPLKDAQIVSERLGNEIELSKLDIGSDVSEALNIVKYEPPIPANLAGGVKGRFPSFLKRTDEEIVQNLTSEYESYKKRKDWYMTEKLDGSPSTFYYREGDFGVCSRNLDLKKPDDVNKNTFWKVAIELDLENKLRYCREKYGLNLALQGELIGEGIQKNPYNIKGHAVKFYNAFDIDNYYYLNLKDFTNIISELNLETVPILDKEVSLPDNISDLITMADGYSILNEKTIREGLVLRTSDRTISFKAISNNFLIKGGE